MAGDWMKIELELPDKPEVHAMAATLNIDPDSVVGKLIRVWQWFDKHTVDGNAYGVTFALPDRISGVTGFGEAMMFVGWLEQKDKTLVMPGFDKHTSASAKARALTAKRVAKSKGKSNVEGNALTVSNALPREEKRREEVNTDNPPKKRKPTKTTIPNGFTISDSIKAWAEANGHSRLEERLAQFTNICQAKSYEYTDWDAAFRNAISGDWAKLGKATVKQPEGKFDVNEWARSKCA